MTRGRHRGDGGPDLVAAAKSARALRRDFEAQERASQLADEMDVVDWLAWARRMSSALGLILEVLDAPGSAAASTMRLPDGSGFLDSQDAETLRAIAGRLGGPR